MERSADIGGGLHHNYLLCPSGPTACSLLPFSFSPSSLSLKVRRPFQPGNVSTAVSPFSGDVVLSGNYSETLDLTDIDWDSLGFSYVPTDYMYTMKCVKGGNFSRGELQRFGNVELNPSAGVLNYCQSSLPLRRLRRFLYTLKSSNMDEHGQWNLISTHDSADNGLINASESGLDRVSSYALDMANLYNSNNNYVLHSVNYGRDKGKSIAVAEDNGSSHYNPLNQDAFRQYGSYVGRSRYGASSSMGTNQEGNNDEEKYFDSLPSGYRFTPYDSELIDDYLIKKINNEKLPPNRIKDVELYKYNPSDLAEMYPANEGKEWYFFTPRDRKYRNGDRPNRRAGDGFWKATGADKPVKKDDVVTGFRKALVFYIGKPPGGHKTDWIMHEYKVNSNTKRVRTGEHDMRLDDWVLCRIYRKADRSSRAKPPEARDIASTSQAEPPEPEPEVCDAIEFQHVLSEDPHSLANLDFMSNLNETQLYPDITTYMNNTFTNSASQLISPASVMLTPQLTDISHI